MAILERALSYLGYEKKSGDATTRIEQLIIDGSYSSTSVTAYQAFKYYQQSAAVAIAVEMIASKVEGMMPVVRDGDKLSDAHPALDLLARPNPMNTRKQFIGELVRHYLISGNSFMTMFGGARSSSLELWPIHPVDAMPEATFDNPWPEVIRITSGFAQGSYPVDEVQGQIVFQSDGFREVIHIKGFSSRNNSVLGDSPLECIASEIEQQLEGKQHNVSLLKNGGRPSLIFNFKGGFSTKESFREAVAFLRSQFGGSKKAGTIAGVNSEELEIHETSITNKDMDFAVLDEASRSVIFTRYGIPLPLVTASRQTHSNFEEAVTTFYYDAIIPAFEAVYHPLARALSRKVRGGENLEITYDPNSIPAIRAEMLKEAKQLADLAILTVNEQRKKLPETEPIEGGDVLLAPASLQPVAGEGVDLAAMMVEDREMQAELARQGAEQGEDHENPNPGAN